MPRPILINHYVEQGTFAVIDNTKLNFGTAGLGTCVGIIAELENGSNFCAHIDVNAREPRNKQEAYAFEIQVRNLLRVTLPPNFVRVFCTTPGGTLTSKLIVQELSIWCGTKLSPPENKMGLYIDATGTHYTNKDYRAVKIEYDGPCTVG
jgi:hypothetical protein